MPIDLIQFMFVIYSWLPVKHRTIEVARHEADSLVKLIKSGTSFEVSCKANSDDKGSAQLGGDLGWFPEGRMVLPFNNACFSGKKGDIKLLKQLMEFILLRFLHNQKISENIISDIIDRKIMPSSLTNSEIYSEASQFAGTNNTYEKFVKSHCRTGLNKRVANDIAPQQKTLPGLDNPRTLIMALFQTEQGRLFWITVSRQFLK